MESYTTQTRTPRDEKISSDDVLPDWTNESDDELRGLVHSAVNKPNTGNGNGRAAPGSTENHSFVNSYSFVPAIQEPHHEWPTLHDDALQGLPGEIVETCDPHTEADPVAILIQSLVSFGSMIGREAHFVAGDSRHYLNLFAVLAGVTSKGRKGTSWATVGKVISCIDQDWYEKRVASGLSSGEGLIWAVRDPIEKSVPVKTQGRHTGERDTFIEDEGISDKRLFVMESEFANVLRMIERDGNSLSAVIRCAWDTGKLVTLVKNSPAKASNAHISIVGHITTEELLRYLNRTESANGFGNRFLWALSRRSKCLPDGGNLHDVDLSDIRRRLSEAVVEAKKTREIRRHDCARELWHQVYPSLSEGTTGMVGSLTGRAEAQVMRLACIYALMEGQPTVFREHLRAALALWDYCDKSVQYIFGRSMGNPLADEVLKAIRESPEGLTRTDISKHFNNNRTKDEIDSALASLSSRGLAASKQGTSGKGRKFELWMATDKATKETKNTKE